MATERVEVTIRRTPPHSRSKIRLGHDVRVSCTCGWRVELVGESGDDADRLAEEAYDAHLLEVAPDLCPKCSGSGERPRTAFMVHSGVGVEDASPCPRCAGTGKRTVADA